MGAASKRGTGMIQFGLDEVMSESVSRNMK